MVLWDESDFFAQPTPKASGTNSPKKKAQALFIKLFLNCNSDVCLQNRPKNFHQATCNDFRSPRTMRLLGNIYVIVRHGFQLFHQTSWPGSKPTMSGGLMREFNLTPQ